MKSWISRLAGACLTLAASAAWAAGPATQVEPLMAKALADMPGKEGLMLKVTYPPGGADEIHRHNAHVFVYVLEGAVEMQLKGGPVTTLRPGQTFYESPADIHVVGRNASATQPASFVVLLLKDAKAAPVLPVN